MIYKSGQRMRALVSVTPHLTMNKIYYVDRVGPRVVYFISDNGEEANVYTESFTSLFELIKEPPRTELEWLDRIQENFRYE